eukprot:GFUD01032293.1.p1 GENE.GFUD01032293.1~~GFUD01032293.1.p1  ORF type:complete len:528 (-),score=150.93 GFUD01032293.1:133-1716(-)
MEKSAMMGDFEKPKVLTDNPSLEPDWLTKKGNNWDREETWWDRDTKGRTERNYSGVGVNLFYILLLLAELILWIKVLVIWRTTSTPGYAVSILLPLLLPSLCLPVLAVLHSLTKGRLSYSSACMLLPPPSPVLLHLLILYRKLQGEEHVKLSLAVRSAGFVQSLLMSFPLVIIALVTLVRNTVGDDLVDMADLHRHLNMHSLQGLAATLSLINLVVSTLRFNERETGRAVSILVGLPFLFTNIGFRLIGYAVLFAYFETAWILLCLGLLFCVSALGVQLGAGETVCGRLCRKVLGDQEEPRRENSGPGVVGALLLSVANVAVPAGYNRDVSLGHCLGRGWRMLIVGWVGTILVHTLVIHHSIVSDVPNTYTGLAPVDMSMIMPKTGLAVNIPNMAGGLNLRLVLPQTKMTMEGEHPASYELQTSHQQDILVAMLVPVLLVLFTVPFTILRMLLLGWNCALTRQEREGDLEEEDDGVTPRPGKTRNCLTVCCGVSGMMMFTSLLMIVVMVYVFVLMQSLTSPLTKEPS